MLHWLMTSWLYNINTSPYICEIDWDEEGKLAKISCSINHPKGMHKNYLLSNAIGGLGEQLVIQLQRLVHNTESTNTEEGAQFLFSNPERETFQWEH
jgi:hypothetical protein